MTTVTADSIPQDTQMPFNKISEEVNMLEGLPIRASSKQAETTQFLPSWLTNPTLISSSITQTSSSLTTNLPLANFLQQNLAASGISHFFPVQLATLKLLLNTTRTTLTPPDIFVRAQTGSGKTLAYILPILHTLSTRIIPRIRALILLPTRDLAIQVKAELDIYTARSNLKCILLGSASYSQECITLSTISTDILVSTPGRLCDHIKNGTVDLSDLRFLVIDEADRLLNQTYQHWLPTVLKATKLPNTRDIKTTRCIRYGHGTPMQKLLFSATLTQNPMKIAGLDLQQPVYICVDAQQSETVEKALIVLPESLQEEMFITTTKMKLAALTWVLVQNQGDPTVIFVKSVASAHRLSAFLNIHLPKHLPSPSASDMKQDQTSVEQFEPTKALTSQLSSQTRKSVLKTYTHTFHILIASDVLSRGIDLPCSLVINYDAPSRSATYAHRVGRTARAGRSGKAVTMLEKRGVRHFKEVIRGCARTGSIVKRGNENEGVEGCMVGIEESLKQLQGLVTGEKEEEEEEGYEHDEYYYPE